MKKPSELILEIVNELKKKDGKEPQTDFYSYEAKAIVIFLDKIK